jgi:hypothetical protein
MDHLSQIKDIQAFSVQLSAISYQRSAISDQLSAFSLKAYRRSGLLVFF